MGNKEMSKSIHHLDFQDNLYLPILQSIKANMYLIDRDFHIHWTNTSEPECGGEPIFGITGRRCHEVYFRSAVPCSDCPVKRVFDCHRPQIAERWLSCPNGEHKCVEMRAYPVDDDRGNAVYAVKIGFDVTERRLAGEKHAQYVEALETRLREGTADQGPSHSGSRRKKRGFSLSNREIQVLQLIAEGFSNLEISGQLAISPHTVKTHVIHIFNKIGVADRTQAAVLATRLGII